MTGVDFDFARYIAHRRGQVEQRARDGAAYSYSGERKVRRALASARPVTMALEATTRLWKNVAKSELLGTSTQVSSSQHSRLHAASRRAFEAMRLDPEPVYVASAGSRVKAQALGTNDDAYIVVRADLLELLTDDELVAVVGHELAHIQNNHVVYATSLYYLQHAAMNFVRWMVQPAIMTLQAWSRRAEITCDRAALLCTRDLRTALSAIVKVELSLEAGDTFDIDAYITELPDGKRGVGRVAELFRSHPYLPKRVQALRVFAESSFYRKYTGATTKAGAESLSAEDVDNQVAEIMSVF